MKKYHDLSFQISDLPSCTFQVDNLEPKLSFTEAAESGLFLISTKIVAKLRNYKIIRRSENNNKKNVIKNDETKSKKLKKV